MLCVGAIQFDVSDDFVNNLHRAAGLIDQAVASGARLIALPECWAGKYGVSNFEKWAEDIEQCAEAPAGTSPVSSSALMAQKAREHGVTVLGGIIERSGDTGEKLFNTLVVYGPDGRLLTTYRKVHLSRVLGITSESDILSPGDRPVIFQMSRERVKGESKEVPEIKVGLCICFDLRFPELLSQYGPCPTRWTGEDSACTIIIASSAFLDTTGVDHWDLLLRRTALDTQCFVIAPNIAFSELDRVPLHGRSAVVDPWGLTRTGFGTRLFLCL